MQIKIKHKFTNAILFEGKFESLCSALVEAAKKGANLYGANLSRANLYGANLSGTDLSGASGVNRFLTTPLYLLLEQVGKIRSYKLVGENFEGPYCGGIKYEIGKSYRVEDASIDETVQCGRGINLATLDWCMKEWRPGYRILIVEHTKKDIAAIPIGSDGKYRVRRCKIVGEKDLKGIGIVS